MSAWFKFTGHDTFPEWLLKPNSRGFTMDGVMQHQSWMTTDSIGQGKTPKPKCKANIWCKVTAIKQQ